MNNLNKISGVFAAILFFGVHASAQYTSSQAKTVLPASSSSTSGTRTPTSTSSTPNTTSIDSGSVATDTNEAEAGGLEATKKQMEANYKEMEKLAGTVINDQAHFGNIAGAYKKYMDNWDTCVTGQKVAAYACLSNLSPKIQDAVAGINTLAAAASASSVNDSCSTFGKAMGVAQAALTAYTAACGAAKGHCGWYCSSTKDAVAVIQKETQGSIQTASCINVGCTELPRYKMLAGTIGRLAGQELQVKDVKSAAGKSEVCTSKYAQLALSAATGIYGVVNALKQGKSCDEASSADSSTATSTSETCAIEANASLPECICLKNPMLEGCGSVAAKSSMSTTGSGLSALSATGSTGTAGLSSADLATGSTATTPTRDPSSSSGSTGIGAPTGGGASLGGSGGGTGGATAGVDDKSGHKALDTNILAGSGGGGGGGGGWGSGGDSGDKSGLRSYLPGGAKDPMKMGGQQLNTSKEVTGQGGKSNWEKVRDRYQDNKSSLLNN